MRHGQIRIQRDGLLVVGERRIQVVCHHEQRGPIRICLRKLRIELNGVREIVERLLKLAGLSQ